MGQLKFFNGYLPQILLGPFLNTLSQINIVMNDQLNANKNTEHIVKRVPKLCFDLNTIIQQ